MSSGLARGSFHRACMYWRNRGTRKGSTSRHSWNASPSVLYSSISGWVGLGAMSTTCNRPTINAKTSATSSSRIGLKGDALVLSFVRIPFPATPRSVDAASSSSSTTVCGDGCVGRGEGGCCGTMGAVGGANVSMGSVIWSRAAVVRTMSMTCWRRVAFSRTSARRFSTLRRGNEWSVTIPSKSRGPFALVAKSNERIFGCFNTLVSTRNDALRGSDQILQIIYKSWAISLRRAALVVPRDITSMWD